MTTPADHDDLARRVEDLTRTVVALQAELHAERRSRHADDAAAVRAGSRRDLLKLAGGTLGGAIVGGVLAGAAQPAAASSGQALVLGDLQYADRATYIGNNASSIQETNTLLTSEPTMFWVDNRAATIQANGIRGDGQGVNGAGVWGHSDSNGIGVKGDGGIGVLASGGRAALRLSGVGAAPPARSDAHIAGEIDIDAAGSVWLCVASGTPGTWRKLGGSSTAGAFHAIDPVRVYDSRWPGDTAMTTGGQRLVSVADGHNLTTGTVDAPGAVPPGATAVAYNITVTGTTGSGYLTVAPGSATSVSASSVNWSSSGQTLANGLIVGLDGSRRVRVFSGGGGSTHFLIDVSGYFL